MYYLDGENKRVYTLERTDPSGKPTYSAHPARFSPDDKYSKYRILLKKRFGILPTQQAAIVWWNVWCLKCTSASVFVRIEYLIYWLVK